MIKRVSMMALLAVALTMLSVSSAQAGSGKGDGKMTNRVEVTNFNSIDTENGDIRIWLLTEEQAADPPMTKGEASALDSVLVAAESMVEFQEDPGNYVLAGANESHFESLADEDSFVIGDNYQILPFSLQEGETKELGAENTDQENLVPNLFDLDDGGGDGDGDN